MTLNLIQIKQFLDYSLNQDLGISGDITSNALISPDKIIEFKIITRENIIFCGLDIIKYFFSDKNIDFNSNYKDSHHIKAGEVIVEGRGNAREILLLERTVLNFLQHLSGVASLTNQYVNETKDTIAKICDTRKTIPGVRSLQKYAVVCGGGFNHRLTLDSSILIKDNHIAICGSIKEALTKAKLAQPFYSKIEIECDNIEQVREAVRYGADIIMLDNMGLEQIRQAVEIINNKAQIDVSGGVDLQNIAAIAKLGVHYISVGKLTHSAMAVDIGLDIA